MRLGMIEMQRLKVGAVRLIQLYRQLAFKGKKLMFLRCAQGYPEKLYRELNSNGIVNLGSVFDVDECEDFIRLSGYSSIKALHDELIKTNDIYGHFNVSRESINYFDSLLRDKKIDVMSIALDYLSVRIGQKYLQYEECLHARGCPAGSEPQLQPHHDTKFNRIKIYLWLTPIEYNPHPLYYKIGDHRSIRTWGGYFETRFPDVEKAEMIELLPHLGDLLLFDTHGLHSHVKSVTGPRLAFLRSIDPVSSFSMSKGSERIRR